MAEQEYERLQSFFFKPKPLIIESKQTVQTVFESPLNTQLYVLKQLDVAKDEKDEKESLCCEVCGGKYSHFNKNRHVLTKKHQSSLQEALSSRPPQ
jgi:hypothetical protein